MLGEYGNGGSKSTGRWEYVWLPTEEDSNGSHAIPVGVYKGGHIYALHTDHLGTPRRATNEAGSLVWQWLISGFGDNKPSGYLKATQSSRQALTNEPVLLRATSPSLELNLRYPGQYFDEETGLHYNLHRSYMPGQGRYTQADPIGLDGGWNRFAYVGGNPLSFTDPDGLQRKDPGSGAGPYHPPDDISLRCTSADDCPVLKQKMELLKRMIDSHEGWDRANPSPRGGGRHAEEIAGLWRAYARCQEMWRKKDCDNCPPPKSFNDWVRDVFQPPPTTRYDPILERPVPVPLPKPIIVPLPGLRGGRSGSF